MPQFQRLVVFDCRTAGVAGDMILGALLDLGVEQKTIQDVAKTVKESIEGCRELKVKIREVSRSGFKAKRVEVKADEVEWRTGWALREAVRRSVERLRLPLEAKKFALEVIDTMVRVEADLHGEDHRKVHLHETGSTDTVFEIVATTVALNELDLFKEAEFYSTPVAVGGGTFKFSHGNVSSPSPATLEILRRHKIPLVGGPVEAELATPTGVSILVNLLGTVDMFYPLMKPLKVGYGAGLRDLPDTPNYLRLVLGEPLDSRILKDEIFLLETNLDDVTGETLGYTMERLFEEGAKDVYLIPTLTKKNRPGNIVKVIADRGRVEPLSRVLFEETGTLGVRIQPCLRHILARETREVEVKIGDLKEVVRVKVSRDKDGRTIRLKPEYEDVKSIGVKTGKPFREAYRLIEEEAWKSFSG